MSRHECTHRWTIVDNNINNSSAKIIDEFAGGRVTTHVDVRPCTRADARARRRTAVSGRSTHRVAPLAPRPAFSRRRRVPTTATLAIDHVHKDLTDCDQDMVIRHGQATPRTVKQHSTGRPIRGPAGRPVRRTRAFYVDRLWRAASGRHDLINCLPRVHVALSFASTSNP
jgi:hypothetical protein